jgi:hypothetical protein
MLIKLQPLHPDQLIEGQVYHVAYKACIAPNKQYIRKGMFLGLMIAQDDSYKDINTLGESPNRLSAVFMFNGFTLVKEGNLVFTHRINWYRITDIYSGENNR